MFQLVLSQIGPFTVSGLVVGAIYALLAFGYSLVYRVLHLINFAHAEVFMLGTLGALATTQALGIAPFNAHAMSTGGVVLVLVACLAAAIIVSVIVSTALELCVYRPIRKRGGSGFAALIASLGCSLFLQELVAHFDGRDLLPFPVLVPKTPLLSIGDFMIRADQVLVFVLALLIAGGLHLFMMRSRFGRSIRAVSIDLQAATLIGVNSSLVVLLTFVLAGASAGAAAFLYLTLYGSTSYLAGFAIGIKAFTAAVLGGMGSVSGALLGGLLIGLLENYGAMVTGSQWEGVYAFIGLLIVLLFRPRGILGERAIRARM
ncbi:MAG: branched-chain amino acid ABC transporter permease [Rhizobiaceae bacterium]|nr:MAG: branched-chain amino acid ABC transporter permease [Rhizobiaceae bacterium]